MPGEGALDDHILLEAGARLPDGFGEAHRLHMHQCGQFAWREPMAVGEWRHGQQAVVDPVSDGLPDEVVLDDVGVDDAVLIEVGDLSLE